MNNYKLCKIFSKLAQAQAAKSFSPKYIRAISPTIASINLTITDLNAAKTLIPPNQSMAVTAISKIVAYLQWYRTVGGGGEAAAMGKDELIPNLEEMKALVKTGLFGEAFITSLASFLKLNDFITQLLGEFALIKSAE